MKSVSIVLSCYKRGRQLRKTLESIQDQNYPGPLEVIVVEDGTDGITDSVAREFKARYFRKERTDLPAFQNPSRVHNIGIKRATGDVVILQGGEVMYVTKPNAITRLVETVATYPYYASPCVASLNKEGRFDEWYCHPTEGERAGWMINFCMAVRRDALVHVGGFEESYTGYGFEDDTLTYCLRKIGFRPMYVSDVNAAHQWHPRTNYEFQYPEGQIQFDGFVREVEAGHRPPVANYGKDWGRL